MSAPESGLVEMIRLVGSARRLLAEHTAVDGRCPVCRSTNISSGHVKAPCSLFLAAKAALQSPK